MDCLKRADLHCHSTASDGTLRPAEVVQLAHDAGLSALALTDHDTIDGLAEAAEAANQLGIDFLTGIEVSCAFPRPGTMHLLGYGFDPHHPSLRQLIHIVGNAREERAELIIQRLKGLGIDLTLNEVREQAGGVGRPHVANALVNRGHAFSFCDAFKRYLGGGGAAYVDNLPLEAPRVIELIRQAGGLVSLAHPFQLRRATFAQLGALVRELADQGLEAMETIHSSHDTEAVHKFTRLADRLGLLTTGGSDYHGPHKPWVRLGEAQRRTIPGAFYEEVINRLQNRRRAEMPALVA